MSMVKLEGIPSQKAVRDRLVSAFQAGRFPQAILLEGPDGVGKKKLALDLAMLLGCTSQEQKPCGHCFHCKMVVDPGAADRWVMPMLLESADRDKPEKVGEATAQILVEILKNPYKPDLIPSAGLISVHQVRQLWQRLSLKADGIRTVIIPKADAMNTNAANALLKTLEEVPPNTYFILTTSNRQGLLQTILSRCIPVGVPINGPDEIKSLLSKYGSESPSADLLGFAMGSTGKAMLCTEGELQDHLSHALEFLEALNHKDLSELFLKMEDWLEKDIEQTLILLEIIGAVIQDLIRLRQGSSVRLQDFALKLRSSSIYDSFPNEWIVRLQEKLSLAAQRLQDRKGSSTQVLQNLVLTMVENT